MTLEEILAEEDIGKKIDLLKEGRHTKLPNVKQLLDDWDPKGHQVNDENVRKRRKVLDKEEYTDEKGEKHPAKYHDEDVNRIALPIEQDIVNIHTAFTVGNDPTLSYVQNNDKEKSVYEIVQSVNRDNKIKYHNKRAVRAWFSETEIVEYWYKVESGGFWAKIVARIKSLFSGNVQPTQKLRCVLWSPFRGDTLYPYYDEFGHYIAQSREYEVRESKTNRTKYFQTVTDKMVYVWRLNDGRWEAVDDQTFVHGFEKIPCIYAYRAEPLCQNIKPSRERYEKLLSNYADCIDYHFFPYLILKGQLEGENGLGKQDERRRMISIENDGDAYYLTWEQTPEAIKLEMDNLLDLIYAMTNTPRITFENLKSVGNIASGVSFRYMFMGTHMAVENHAETIGEFMQRRYNFLVHAIGKICPTLAEASNSIEINVDIVPYMIDDLSDKLDIAGKAIEAGLISKKSAMMFVGMTDRVEDEIEQMKSEKESESALGSGNPNDKQVD